MGILLKDLQHAARALARSPGFTAVAVLALALGIGPNTAIFSIIHAVLLRPLPFKDPERVVMLWEAAKQRGFDQLPVSGPTFIDWKRDNHVFEDMAPAFAIPVYGFNVTAGGEPERVQAAKVAANYFSVLGMKPFLGRGFLPEEDRPGGNPVVLVSHAFWQRRFGSDPRILGRSIGLDGVSHTVVGVFPPEFQSLARVDLVVPVASNLAQQNRDHHNYGVMARLKPGVTVAQAQAEMDTISRRLEEQYPDSNTGVKAVVIPVNEILSGRIRPALMVLLAAVGFLLLIACANVASLYLARAVERRKDIAVRAALGASRWHLVRQLLTESLLLSLLGGLVGLLLAAWSVWALRGLVPDVIPRLKEMGVDARVLAFTLGLSVLTGVLFGVAPALRASRPDLNQALKEGGGRGAVGGGSQRSRSVLLVAEVALAFVLLVGAGLMMRSFLHVIAVHPGFRAGNVLTMHLTLPWSKYGDSQKRAAFCKSVLARVEALPGVRSAAAISFLPMRGSILSMRVSVMPFQVEGRPAERPGQEPTAALRVITPRFLGTMGIPLRKGRNLTERDAHDTPRVALVNETMVRRYFPDREPVGSRFRLPPFDTNLLEIVGVVGDVKLYGLESRVEPAIYVPYTQDPAPVFSLLVRSGSDPAALAPSVRREILAVDPDQPVSDVLTMEQVLSDSLLVRRLSVWMLGVFAGLALVLATVGIYGLASYTVSQRTHEIAVRMALGARQSNVLRMILRRGLLVALIGVSLGLPAAIGLARLMRGLLYGVTAADPIVFLAVPLLLVSVAILASYLPSRRAARVDPMTALHQE